jgi:carboxymethylenebutenolidase
VPVTAAEIEYAPGIRGYLARPESATGALPGLILIHEWWGLNDNIQSMARRFAGEGYAALAVDLYGGAVASERSEAMTLMGKAMADRAAAEANLRAAASYLQSTLGSPRLGVVGWCFGGGWSLETAIVLGTELDAAVIYYGRLTTAEERLAAISAPVLGLFGAEDEGIPVSSVEAFEQTMKRLGKAIEIKVYSGADHAFANPSGTRYQAEAATDAWQRSVGFLAVHLRRGESGSK